MQVKALFYTLLAPRSPCPKVFWLIQEPDILYQIITAFKQPINILYYKKTYHICEFRIENILIINRKKQLEKISVGVIKI